MRIKDFVICSLVCVVVLEGSFLFCSKMAAETPSPTKTNGVIVRVQKVQAYNYKNRLMQDVFDILYTVKLETGALATYEDLSRHVKYTVGDNVTGVLKTDDSFKELQFASTVRDCADD